MRTEKEVLAFRDYVKAQINAISYGSRPVDAEAILVLRLMADVNGTLEWMLGINNPAFLAIFDNPAELGKN